MTADRNRLGEETSPYLLQHRDNPVHWWPWNDEAFARARTNDRPILLSVGYSACHWCHVMAHESFEDAETAEMMNSLFINIKVDREERPDVDAVYQKALALMGEHGGWPLTMFLSPAGKPFWGGTYFPPSPAYGRPSFRQVLGHIDRVWREQRSDVDKQSDALLGAISEQHIERLRDGMSIELLNNAAERLLDYIDASAGGMNGAPKFPMPFVFDFLWRAYRRTGDARFRDAVTADAAYLKQAEDWVAAAIALYGDDAAGGFFFTAGEARDLIVRSKTANDSAVPSGNGSMAFALARLFYLTGKADYRARAAATVTALEVEVMKSFPHGTTLLNAYELLETAQQVVIVGDSDALLRTVFAQSLPNLVLDVVADGALLPTSHPAHGKTQLNDAPTAYVCRGPVCSPPQTTVDSLRQALAS